MVIFLPSSPGSQKVPRCIERDLSNYAGAFMVIANRFPKDNELEKKVREYNAKKPFCLDFVTPDGYGYKPNDIRVNVNS